MNLLELSNSKQTFNKSYVCNTIYGGILSMEVSVSTTSILLEGQRVYRDDLKTWEFMETSYKTTWGL